MRQENKPVWQRVRSYLAPRCLDGRLQPKSAARPGEGAKQEQDTSKWPHIQSSSRTISARREKDRASPSKQLFSDQRDCLLFSMLPAEMRQAIYAFCLSDMYLHIHYTVYYPEKHEARWGHRVLPNYPDPNAWIHPFALIPLDGQDPTKRRQLSLPLACRRMYATTLFTIREVQDDLTDADSSKPSTCSTQQIPS